MIWLCSRPVHADDMRRNLDRWEKALPFDRLQKIRSYRMLSDKWLCAAAYRLLQHGLSSEYGIMGAHVQLDYASSGKPFLKGIPGIHFNTSHCDIGAVCALSNQEIGVDIEGFSFPTHQVLRRVLNDDEYKSVLSALYPDKAFTRLWTLKESWLKATGFGLSYGAKQLHTSLLPTSPYLSHNGFTAQIAWESEKGCISQCSKEGKLLPLKRLSSDLL